MQPHMAEDHDVVGDPIPAPQPGLLEAAPTLARLAGEMWLRTTQWTLATGFKAGRRVAQAAMSGESAVELAEDIRTEFRRQARNVLGVTDFEERLGDVMPGMGVVNRVRGRRDADDGEVRDGIPVDPLRAAGEELLARSSDVTAEDGAHPAYAGILANLAPDEARILRLLMTNGPAPAVDVRTARPLGVGSELVAEGLSMIGNEAGARYPERVPAYLNNLYRLGLIWFSREPISDNLRYQVLEAQPDVLAAIKRAGRARTIRRSIHVTPFGKDFCETCLPLHTSEYDVLGGGTETPDTSKATST